MRWTWLLWLIPVYLIALIVFAPARLVGWTLTQTGAAQQVSLHGLEGSLWSGSAASVETRLPTGAPVRLQDVTWHVHPWSLFTGTLMVDFRIPQLTNLVYGQGSLVATSTGLEQFNADLSGSILSGATALDLPLPLTIDGRWNLRVQDYRLADWQQPTWCSTLAGTVAANAVQVKLDNRWLDLGNFDVQLQCTEAEAITVTMPQNNRLGLGFEALVEGSRQIPRGRIDGFFKPTIETPAEVQELLPFLGQPDAAGRYAFGFRF
ncbi:MAG TPA: type II secretion system protein N [Pseudidiomarina sp.]|nr:type II secretion system protein N [Pseudidiomarina sp.]